MGLDTWGTSETSVEKALNIRLGHIKVQSREQTGNLKGCVVRVDK